MKLIENPIRLNASLHKMLPYTMRYLYGKITVKAFRLYTLGAVHVYFIEGFGKNDVVMTHDTRTIKQDEIDFVVAKLFPNVAPAELTLNHAAKNQIESDLHRKIRVKDLVIIEHAVA
ncbi:DUF1827 family protein [Lacticaseibacillus kribbianus]|uniref:DUF1827 family protein n=1 Tax=Lacticaseibacillus kribbianus TaxID=2926292 RepID=UPI001CD5017C|nr:DUF1827 family protein [Lacticaseibacillus kribbianus]